MFNLTFFGVLFALWSTVTFLLGMLLVYRATVSMKEEDLLFLDPAEASLVEGQQQIQARLHQLSPYVKMLSVGSVTLLVAMFSVIVYEVVA